MPQPSLLTLVSGGSYQQREALIAASIKTSLANSAAAARQTPASDTRIAVILEGLPGGDPLLNDLPNLLLQRIAPGCMCCIGNLALRVTLNRLLRQQPAQLFIGIASSEHLEQIHAFLSQAPYADLLQLNPDLQIT
ncbi:GTPase [Undibacterium sp. Jales W-56]|uniref:GTPase n=1 Tax=Undibacterium sp. Jales W-56 TaxID=2897325 RepID=UPI0021D3A131|nr:GTPase [Undibacterium sp. Jales W-56]MCU6434182.1 GTPase [Undibacterium sp. Jales W-56]